MPPLGHDWSFFAHKTQLSPGFSVQNVKVEKNFEKMLEKVLTNAYCGGILAKLSARDIANDSAKDLEN